MLASLIEGLTDALGFVVGALLGYGVGMAFGLDLFAPGYGTGSIIAIMLVGLGAAWGSKPHATFVHPRLTLNKTPPC